MFKPSRIKLMAVIGLAAGLMLLSTQPCQAGGAVKALVSLAPQKYFVDRIGRDLVSVKVMIPAGADAHTFEPKPRQMKALTETDLYFAIGVEFEENWLDRYKTANPNLKIIPTQAGVPRVAMAGKDEDHHGQAKHHDKDHDGQAKHHDEDHDQDRAGHSEEHHHGLDPHIWLSPRLVGLQAATMAKGLAEADPDNKAAYKHNLASFLAELDALDRELAQAFKGLGNHRRVLVYHPAWGYFCRDYGLTMIAIEKEGKKPTAKGLAHLIDQARREGARVVFVQPQFSTRSAQTLAQAINGRVVAINPLAPDWAANLRRVAEELKAAAF